MSIIVYIDPDIQRVIKTSPDDVADLRRFEPSGSPSENLTGSGTGFWSLSPILVIKTSIFSITGLFWLTSENIGIGSVIKIITSWKIYIDSVFFTFLQNDDKISCWVENDLNSQEPQPNEYANLHLYLYISTHTCISYIHVSTSSFSFRTDLQMETSISRITSKHNFYIISIQSIKFAFPLPKYKWSPGIEAKHYHCRPALCSPVGLGPGDWTDCRTHQLSAGDSPGSLGPPDISPYSPDTLGKMGDPTRTDPRTNRPHRHRYFCSHAGHSFLKL